LAKRGEPDIHSVQQFDITQPQVLIEGSTPVALLCHGSIAEEAMQAARILAKEAIHPRVISVPMLQPLDRSALLHHLKGVRAVVTVEEHYRSCGFGASLREVIMDSDLSCSLTTLGIPSRFIHEIHNTSGMRKLFKIEAESIAAMVKQLCER
jgi:transketolase C-terminal domain/subunit